MLHDFGIVIHAPLSVPPTMHIVISINSICSRFIRSDSFIPRNQKDPAALSLLTHSVSLVDFITSINLIETIYSIISISFNFDSILDIIDCSQSQCCQLNLSKNQENFAQLANICFVPFQCIVSFLENFLVQTAPLNLSVIPSLSWYLSVWLIPFSHNFHAIIP